MRGGFVFPLKTFRPLVAARVLAYISACGRRARDGVHQVLFCEECGCDSDNEARGWQAHLACEDDGSTTVAPGRSWPRTERRDARREERERLRIVAEPFARGPGFRPGGHSLSVSAA